MTKKPGENSGDQGGIYRETTPGGKPVPNHTTVPEGRPMPPTSKPGNVWTPQHMTPPSKPRGK